MQSRRWLTHRRLSVTLPPMETTPWGAAAAAGGRRPTIGIPSPSACEAAMLSPPRPTRLGRGSSVPNLLPLLRRAGSVASLPAGAMPPDDVRLLRQEVQKLNALAGIEERLEAKLTAVIAPIMEMESRMSVRITQIESALYKLTRSQGLTGTSAHMARSGPVARRGSIPTIRTAALAARSMMRAPAADQDPGVAESRHTAPAPGPGPWTFSHQPPAPSAPLGHAQSSGAPLAPTASVRIAATLAQDGEVGAAVHVDDSRGQHGADAAAISGGGAEGGSSMDTVVEPGVLATSAGMDGPGAARAASLYPPEAGNEGSCRGGRSGNSFTRGSWSRERWSDASMEGDEGFTALRNLVDADVSIQNQLKELRSAIRPASPKKPGSASTGRALLSRLATVAIERTRSLSVRSTPEATRESPRLSVRFWLFVRRIAGPVLRPDSRMRSLWNASMAVVRVLACPASPAPRPASSPILPALPSLRPPFPSDRLASPSLASPSPASPPCLNMSPRPPLPCAAAPPLGSSSFIRQSSSRSRLPSKTISCFKCAARRPAAAAPSTHAQRIRYPTPPGSLPPPLPPPPHAQGHIATNRSPIPYPAPPYPAPGGIPSLRTRHRASHPPPPPPRPVQAWFWLNFFFDLWFITDVLICLRTGYYVEGHFVDDDVKAAKHYVVKGSFLMDVVGSFPINIVLLAVKGCDSSSSVDSATEACSFARGNRILRLMRMFKLTKLTRLLKCAGRRLARALRCVGRLARLAQHTQLSLRMHMRV